MDQQDKKPSKRGPYKTSKTLADGRKPGSGYAPKPGNGVGIKPGCGKPTKLNEELQERFLGKILEGSPPDDAALLVGIHPYTWKHWLEKARNGDPKYVSFIQAGEAAEASWRGKHLKNISSIAHGESKGMWQASAWLLERRYQHVYALQSKFGPSVTVEQNVSLKDALDRVHEISKMSLTHQTAPVIDVVPVEVKEEPCPDAPQSE